MPKTDPLKAAVAIIRRLRDHGHQAVLAGGCVRDMLLDRRPKDYDVATSARPDQIVALFRRTQKVGIQFGVVIVWQGGNWIEVATFRSDGAYLDGRHPHEVTFSSPREDATRRDFTVNGMFYDPIDGKVLDYVGGKADIQARIIRAIGDPTQRINEDRLRLLRAVRFAAKLQFEIDPATEEAVKQQASQIATVSAERIREELDLMFSDPQRALAVQRLTQLELLRAVLPEAVLDAREGGLIVDVVAGLPARSPFELTMAVLLWSSPPPTVNAVCRRLTCSNKSRRTIKWLVRNQTALDSPDKLGLADLKILIADRDYPLLLDWARARGKLNSRIAEAVARIEKRQAAIPQEAIAPPPLLTGEDLLAMNLPQGPLYKRLLDAVYHAQLDETVRTKKSALALARKLADQKPRA